VALFKKQGRRISKFEFVGLVEIEDPGLCGKYQTTIRLKSGVQCVYDENDQLELISFK